MLGDQSCHPIAGVDPINVRAKILYELSPKELIALERFSNETLGVSKFSSLKMWHFHMVLPTNHVADNFTGGTCHSIVYRIYTYVHAKLYSLYVRTPSIPG